MSRFTSCETRTESWTGSASGWRTWTSARRGTAVSSALLRAVLRAPFAALRHPGRVQPAPDDLVPVAGEIADAPATDENDGVLLQVVPLAGDVRADLDPVREPHARDLAERRVRLLRRHRRDARADTPLLRGALECGR